MHLPYAEIEKRQIAFIETKYLPRGIKIRQPWNLTKEVIQVIFEHLTKHQEMMGAKDAFRFKSVKVGKSIVRALYRLCNESPKTDHNHNAKDDDSIVPSADTPDHHHM